MKHVIQLDAFKKEIVEFPLETREDIFSLVDRYLRGERLHRNDFKTFKIDRHTKIQEFKVKDHRGNWRAVSCVYRNEFLVFVHAFHKKAQELSERDKEIIRNRVRRISL